MADERRRRPSLYGDPKYPFASRAVSPFSLESSSKDRNKRRTGDADGDELGAKVSGRGPATGIGMLALQVAGHDALLGRQEVRVGVAEVAHGALGRVLRHQIGEDPADGLQLQLARQPLHQLLARVLQQPHRVPRRLLRPVPSTETAHNSTR